MGVRFRFDAFVGAYSAFHRLRWHVCRSFGGSWPPHDDGSGYPDDQYFYPDEMAEHEHWPGFELLFGASDTNGIWSPDEALMVAGALRWSAERLAGVQGSGHLAMCGEPRQPCTLDQLLVQFAEGCERCHAEGLMMTWG